MPAETKAQLAERHAQLAETLEWVEYDRDRLSEALGNAVQMLRQEDAGWAEPGFLEETGLSLESLKKWSRDIRTSLSGTHDRAPNPHMRNGLMLRHSFIWQGGIHYDGIPGEGDASDTANPNRARRGKANVQRFIDDPQNQRLVFSKTARQRRESALYSDGLYIVIGQNSNKRMRVIPLKEVTDTMRDKFFQDEIIAYRWTRNEIDGRAARGLGGTPGRIQKSYWVYVDWYEGDIPDFINYNGKNERVLKEFTAFDLHANRPEGAAYGSPDSIAAVVWARIIRDLIMNGVKMQDALAMFAFKAVAPTKRGQTETMLELGKKNQAGSAATLGPDQDLVPLNTAGKGYDFSTIGFVVATMAASLHLSGIALSANTALAGSSYGAAKTLDLPGRMAMETRRAEHVEFDKRILHWMGAPDAKVYFDNYDDATDEYRAVQAAMLLWSSGNMTPEAFKEAIEVVYGRDLIGNMPEGVINPNTVTQADKDAEEELAKKAAENPAPAPDPASTKKPAAKKTTPAANQGKDSGAGGAGHANDM